MCGCFVLALGSVAPRFALVLMALFNDAITRAFDGSWVWPFIGWLFLPYSTLTFVLFNEWGNGVSGFDWVFVGIAVLADLGLTGSGAKAGRDRQSFRPPGGGPEIVYHPR